LGVFRRQSHIKKCPICQNSRAIKKGKRRNVQRYQCAVCGANYQSKRRKSKLQKKIWHEYVSGKQTATELGNKYGKSRQWISKQLSEITVDDKTIVNNIPQSIVVVADATFFSRSYGVLMFREPNLKKYLAWKEIYSETPGQYERLKLELESQGFNIIAVVLDGKRGVRDVFPGIPI